MAARYRDCPSDADDEQEIRHARVIHVRQKPIIAGARTDMRSTSTPRND